MGTGTINSKKRYLTSLTNKHRELDNKIVKITNTASDQEIKALKQQKLQLKEQIVALETEILT
jgi:uncharacterized protein YdcH (DUF465 family)